MTATASPAATAFPGYAVPAGSYAAPPVRHTSHTRMFLILGTGLALVVVAMVAVSALVTPRSTRYVCPPNCGSPPVGEPVQTNPRFTAGNGDFSVSYPGEGSAYKATMNPNGVTLDFLRGDKGTLQLFGEPAGNRTPQQIAADLIKRNYPDATTAYQIPNAMVGYQAGYGEAADAYPQGASTKYAHTRVLVMVAVKNGLALIAAATGPYHQFGPDFGSGRPSAANLQLALDMGKYVNSFAWRGDPPR
ncbi:hypothetical protein [Mycobacterium sp.]|jgi:hypothetical protein|uniref:hypothetical protein n=1 Tax=Mycobacterium sp. TaxID=1785 RepID=UPI002D5713FD|nr:hypothetical protein [Mycobacterium sp.]HZA08873.1 hypothetical protein [Mycobacterium sp.]